MRAIAAVAMLLLLACGTPAPPTTPADPANPATRLTLALAPDSSKVDRIGALDGAIKPDGVNDYAFAVGFDGAIKAIFLAAVDETGKSNGRYQADTLIGDQEVPKEVSVKWGGGTAGLAVFENDKLLNEPSGALRPIGEGAHRLVLYIAMVPQLTPGTRLRVFIQRPDGVVAAGDIVTL